MPIGERHATTPRPASTPARGVTYLLLLFGLAALGAGLAALGTQWQAAAQRGRETELLWRGLQWRDALQRFHEQTPDGQPALPQQADELLRDTRWPTPRHHLRQAWADPFTGQADWVLLRQADGGIVGLHSRSQRPLQRRHGLPTGVDPAADAGGHPGRAQPPQARDWQFSITPSRPTRNNASTARQTP